MLRIIIEIGDPLKLQHTAFYDEQPFKKYLAKGYAYNQYRTFILKT